MARTFLRALPLLLALPLGACASGTSGSLPFSPHYPDNRADAVAPVLSRLASHTATPDASVLLGLTKAPTNLVAIDLVDGRERFRVPVDARTAPSIAGDYAVVQTATDVVGYLLSDGTEAFRIPLAAEGGPQHLVGAAGEGPTAAVVLSGQVGDAASQVFVIDDGDVDFHRPVPQPAGVPAVRAGMVFVPWGYQNLSILEAANGHEIARVRITQGMVGHALAHGSTVVFGQRVLYRLDGNVVGGNGASVTSYSPPETGLPDAPPLFTDPYRPPPAPTSAAHHIELGFHARPDTGLAMADDSVYLVFYKLIFGLSATDGSPRWARTSPEDLVAAAAFDGGFVVADERGTITVYRASDGAPRARRETGIPLEVAVLSVGAPLPETLPLDPLPPLHDQLLVAAQTTDNRLLPARRLAVQKLAGLSDPQATADLVVLCDDARMPDELKRSACQAVAQRPHGEDQVVAALSRHARFLDGTAAPPVGPLASAAATMHEARAVPFLVSHLSDPATPLDALEPIVVALGQLGDASAAPALRDFLRLYHADLEDYEMGRILRAAAESYATLAGAQALPTLDEIAADPYSDRSLSTAAAQIASRLRSAANPTPAAASTPASAPPPAAPLPTHLTRDAAEASIAGVRPELIACVRNDPAHPSSARMTVVVERDGTVQRVATIPASIEPCFTALVTPLHFPATRGQGRQQVVLTIPSR
ncbi:MAG: hypothetical protein U0230_18645 [Polyangiales bacterium]